MKTIRDNLLIRSLLVGMLCLLVAREASAREAGAQPPDLEQPDEAARATAEGLARTGRYPWYDAETDDVRRIEVEARKTKTPARRKESSSSDWINHLFQMLGWSGVAVIFLLIVGLLIYAFLGRESEAAKSATDDDEDDARRAIDRVEALPFKVRHPTSDLLSEARKHYERGDYGEAIIYLFSHQLVELDRCQWIHLAQGKTNRQYLGELASSENLRGVLEQTMVAFEEVFFGHHALDRRRFEACWSRLPAFNELMKQVPV